MAQKSTNIVSIRQQRKKYSPQFKEQAVELSKKEGVPKAAKDLDIHEGLLYSWCKKHKQTGIPFEEQKMQAAELARLKRENARLSEENAFLKKVATYFAKDEERGTK